MHHQRQIDAVEITPAHEFGLAAEIFDLSFVDQPLAELQLDHLLRRDQQQPDPAAQTVQGAGFLQGRRNAHHLRALAVVAAAVGHAVDGFGMVRDVQRVQLAHNGQRRSGTAGIEVYIKPRYVTRFDGRIPVTLEFLKKISICLPFGIPCLRMLPDPTFRI